MTEPDARRLAEIRVAHSGRTHYEGQLERDDEFLLRLLDVARAKGRNEGLKEAATIIGDVAAAVVCALRPEGAGE